ncbi:MAG: gliding motility-associated C-terminal domain-containing protein, partial [Cyclobacteriaceae bacterium]|nr:gliding motility-associated C-terminal domain-containing protein [Cyclobacteriaceae bacterium]
TSQSPLLSDLDGDGRPEVLAVDGFTRAFSVYRNTSTSGMINGSSLEARADFVVGNNPIQIVTGDVDGDGAPDVIINNLGDNMFSIFRNVATNASAVSIGSFLPTSGSVGTIVTISGSNFDPVPSNNVVSFNGVYATVTASTTTSITTIVPPSATDGLIQVIANCHSGSLGTFTVGSSGTIVISPQPISSSVCNGSLATFAVGASGTTNILYQWQKFNGSVFTDVANGGGYSGVTSTTFIVNTVGNFGAGDYRCKVSGDFASDVFSNTVTLTVNSLPSAPSTPINGSSCGTASITLSASGGSAGQYRWYSVASGGSAIAGEVNASYTTPSLSATTTYYVAINNGTCESARTAVVANINAVPSAPSGTGASGCSPSALTLTASGGAAGQYRWYTTSTGGAPIASQTNATFATPTLSATTTYFVSINNGTCESTRTAVTATISGSCAQPPVITPPQPSLPIEGQISVNLVPQIITFTAPLDIASIAVVKPPVSGARASVDNGTLTLDYSGIMFSGTDQLTVRACDLAANCAASDIFVEVAGDITVFNAVSPNGDSKNEVFYIQYVDLIPETQNNKVTIFNRWGDIVFETDNYDNDGRAFRGLNTSGNELPNGTYFYRIEFATGRETKTGFLALKR